MQKPEGRPRWLPLWSLQTLRLKPANTTHSASIHHPFQQQSIAVCLPICANVCHCLPLSANAIAECSTFASSMKVIDFMFNLYLDSNKFGDSIHHKRNKFGDSIQILIKKFGDSNIFPYFYQQKPLCQDAQTLLIPICMTMHLTL